MLGRSFAAALLAIGLGGPAAAVPVLNTVDVYLRGTECGANGYFAIAVEGVPGNGFGDCAVNIDDQILSPVIVKFGGDLEAGNQNDPTDTSALYPSVTGSEFSFSNLADDGDDENISGMWSYTPGEGDPSVKYWAAKAGNGFNLFWSVATNAFEEGGACADEALVFSCLSAAVAVTSGTWFTPDEKELSHLTFFNNAGSTPAIPLPAAGWLLIAGLGGLAAMRRKRAA